MTHRYLASTAFALAFAAVSGAWAQTSSPPQTHQAQQSGSAPVTTGADTMQHADEYLGEDIIGARVHNQQGENIGSVTNLVIDKDGQVKSAILSVGGFLGIGDKHVAVPWKEIQVRSDKAVRNATRTDTTAPSARPSQSSGSASNGATGTGMQTTAPANSAADAARNPYLVVNMTKDQLRQAPAFKTMAQQSRDTRTTPPANAPGTTAPPAGTAPRQ